MFLRKHTSVGAFGDNSLTIKRNYVRKGGDLAFHLWLRP